MLSETLASQDLGAKISKPDTIDEEDEDVPGKSSLLGEGGGGE